MAVPTPHAAHRAVVARSLGAAGPVSVTLSDAHDIVATSVLTATTSGLRGIPHIGRADAACIVVGQLADDSDTVLIAWSRTRAPAASRVTLSIEQSGHVLADIDVGLNIAADVPDQIANACSVYVLRLSVRHGRLTPMVAPADAVVSLDGIARWLSNDITLS
jgi:hypothetical protein